MSTLVACLLSSTLVATLITSLTEIFLWRAKKKDKDEDKHDELVIGLTACQEKVDCLSNDIQSIAEEMRYYVSESSDLKKSVVKTNKLLMAERIRSIAKKNIVEGKITLEERKLLHDMWDEYHVSWNGNGDLNALMKNVDDLPVEVK